MKKFTRWVTTLVLATSLASAVAPVRSAQAGFLLTPIYGIGLIILWIGAAIGEEYLILLDANSPSGDGVEQMLIQRYGFLDDRAVIADLASAIRAKARATAPDAQGRREVRLERARVLQILEPTGLVETSPAQVQRLITDLT